MSAADLIRALRLYYRSFGEFRRAFRDHHKAWLLPFGGTVNLHSREGDLNVHIPRGHWPMLASISRLVLQGFEPMWTDEGLVVAAGAYRFLSPPFDKSIGVGLKEIFIDDVYRILKEDLRGRTVLDVGAHIGDSTVAFAARGARVHAFEPVPVFQEYLEKNIARNGLHGSVVRHPVGLANANLTVKVWVNLTGTAGTTAVKGGRRKRGQDNFVEQELRLVDAVPYLGARGIRQADLLKLDCEGCEYALFANGALLELLQPRRVVMEFHDGSDRLASVFSSCGYDVEATVRTGVGYLEAIKRSSA